MDMPILIDILMLRYLNGFGIISTSEYTNIWKLQQNSKYFKLSYPIDIESTDNAPGYKCK